MASLDNILDILVAQDAEFNNVMVVGHNPGLTSLANDLVPGLTSNLPTAGYVSVLLDTETWDLRGRKSSDLVKYDYPKSRKKRKD